MVRDIVKEIREVEVSEEWREKGTYFKRGTTISRTYFNNEVIKRYHNLIFIRIFMKKTTFIPTFHESLRDDEYYFYSVFIDKNVLEFLDGDGLVKSLSGEKVIDVSRFVWQRQIELRNKIFRSCSIIMAECNRYCDSSDRFVGHMNIKLSDNVSIYPYSYKIEDYEFLNSTHFVLISNSGSLRQKDLDNFCLEILDKLSQENQRVVASEKEIYLSISKKLKCNLPLDQVELMLVEQFLISQMEKIDNENTLLVRSRVRGVESGNK